MAQNQCSSQCLKIQCKNVYDTQKDVEQKQYLLATGQLEDAHSLPNRPGKSRTEPGSYDLS